MSGTMKFFVCRHCGNVAELLNDAGVKMTCCGEVMAEMKPNTADAAKEKHVPVCTRERGVIRVQVGSAAHPMLAEHHIGFIRLVTKLGGQLRRLEAGDAPAADFVLGEGDEPVEVYAWCNLHGLWKADFS